MSDVDDDDRLTAGGKRVFRDTDADRVIDDDDDGVELEQPLSRRQRRGERPTHPHRDPLLMRAPRLRVGDTAPDFAGVYVRAGVLHDSNKPGLPLFHLNALAGAKRVLLILVPSPHDVDWRRLASCLCARDAAVVRAFERLDCCVVCVVAGASGYELLAASDVTGANSRAHFVADLDYSITLSYQMQRPDAGASWNPTALPSADAIRQISGQQITSVLVGRNSSVAHVAHSHTALIDQDDAFFYPDLVQLHKSLQHLIVNSKTGF